MSPEMSAALEQAANTEDYLILDDPNYPTTKITGMSVQSCQDVIDSADISPNRGSTQHIIAEDLAIFTVYEQDLPTACAQWLLQGEIRACRRKDLEEQLESPEVVFEITQENRTAFVVIDDRSLPPDEVKFKVHDPNNDPTNIPIFSTTPAEAERLLELTAAFSESDGNNQKKLSNTRKQKASLKGKITASLTHKPAA